MKKGFTLIELSIVLVIIALITGGVLVGRDLIEAATIRSTVRQKEQYDTAVNTFRLKYNCMPGDCVNAANFGFTWNGNGNGVLDNLAVGSELEYKIFHAHLTRAGFIQGDLTGAPVCDSFEQRDCAELTKLKPRGGTFPPAFFIRYSDPLTLNFRTNGKHYYWLIGCTGELGAGETGCAVYSPQQTFMLDSKIDDGLPLTGALVAHADVTAITSVMGYPADIIQGPGGASSDFCVSNSTTPASYNFVNNSGSTGSLCSLSVSTAF